MEKGVYGGCLLCPLYPLLLRGHDGERNNYFSKIQLSGQKYRDKITLASKRDSATIVLVFKSGASRY